MAKVSYVGQVLRINAPEWYENKEFLTWLNGGGNHVATWHEKGKPPSEYSDVFVTFDHGEGSDAWEIPPSIWARIMELAAENNFVDGLVWISNIPE